MDELLPVTEVARRLGGISVSTVRAWLSQGRMNRTKVGRRTMVRESQLLRMTEEPCSTGQRGLSTVSQQEKIAKRQEALEHV